MVCKPDVGHLQRQGNDIQIGMHMACRSCEAVSYQCQQGCQGFAWHVLAGWTPCRLSGTGPGQAPPECCRQSGCELSHAGVAAVHKVLQQGEGLSLQMPRQFCQSTGMERGIQDHDLGHCQVTREDCVKHTKSTVRHDEDWGNAS